MADFRKEFIDSVVTLLKLTDFMDDKDLSKWQDEFFFGEEYFPDESEKNIPEAWKAVKEELGDLPICISREDAPRFVVENADCWYGEGLFEIFASLIDSYAKNYQDVGADDFSLFELGDTGVKLCIFQQGMGDEPMYYLPREDFKALEKIGKDGQGILPSNQELKDLCYALEDRGIVDSTFYDNIVEAISEIFEAEKEETREIDADEFLVNVKNILSENSNKLAFERTMTGDWQDAINGWDDLVGKLMAEVRAYDRYCENNVESSADVVKRIETIWAGDMAADAIEEKYGFVLDAAERNEVGKFIYDAVQDSDSLDELRGQIELEALDKWCVEHDNEYQARAKGVLKNVAKEAKEIAKGGSGKSVGRDTEER